MNKICLTLPCCDVCVFVSQHAEAVGLQQRKGNNRSCINHVGELSHVLFEFTLRQTLFPVVINTFMCN